MLIADPALTDDGGAEGVSEAQNGLLQDFADTGHAAESAHRSGQWVRAEILRQKRKCQLRIVGKLLIDARRAAIDVLDGGDVLSEIDPGTRRARPGLIG